MRTFPTTIGLIDAQIQCCHESFDRHNAAGHFRTGQQMIAYTAGFGQGWAQAVAYLKLHHGLKVKD